VGIAGAAWGCTIMAVRVANPEGKVFLSDLSNGIRYAADNGADVINISSALDSSNFLLEAAILHAESKGCVVVAASGDSNASPIQYPARYSTTIAVGASDAPPNEYGRWTGSSWGTEDRPVDVVAPGANIYSTYVSPVNGNSGYATGAGTSFSAPIVSGLAALVISHNPGITPEQVKNYIKAGASVSNLQDDPVAGSDWYGSGMVQFSQTDSLPVTLSAFTSTTTPDGKVILRWTTETELNNIGWNIYRSTDKTGSFTNIDFVSSAGDSAFPNNYEYVDENVVSGITYLYYIEDIDIQGQRSKSKIVEAMPKTAVKAEIVEIMPAEFQVFQNYPNPFNPATWIPYQLAENTEVTIRIYNVAGRLIRTLELGNQKAGFYLSKEKAAYWNGTSDNNEHVAGGVYFYQIKIGKRLTSVRKMVLLK
jgi:hypothetical protein